MRYETSDFRLQVSGYWLFWVLFFRLWFFGISFFVVRLLWVGFWGLGYFWFWHDKTHAYLLAASGAEFWRVGVVGPDVDFSLAGIVGDGFDFYADQGRLVVGLRCRAIEVRGGDLPGFAFICGIGCQAGRGPIHARLYQAGCLGGANMVFLRGSPQECHADQPGQNAQGDRDANDG